MPPRRPSAILSCFNSGSLFCACTRSSLVAALEQIAGHVRPDLVLAEATGVAETSDLFDLLETPPLAGSFRLQANLCLVDTLNFTKVLPYLKAARTQVACADGLAINKTDLLPPAAIERLAALLADINPLAPQARIVHGRLPWPFLAGLRHVRRSPEALQSPPGDIVVCSIPNRRADRRRLTSALESLGERLLRLKGILDFGHGPCLVESVFGAYSERPLDRENLRPGSTALGREITQDDLRQHLAPAFLPDPQEL
ncbi:MAG: GTP-binding protein, partial [Thermoguttaceae bacterium]